MADLRNSDPGARKVNFNEKPVDEYRVFIVQR